MNQLKQILITVLNSIKGSIYNKRYTKEQDYLAIIGLLVKIIILISNLLNYYNSQNSYYLKIIKDFIIENKILEKYILQKKILVIQKRSDLESCLRDYQNRNPQF